MTLAPLIHPVPAVDPGGCDRRFHRQGSAGPAARRTGPPGSFGTAEGKTDSTVTMLHGGDGCFVENRQATGFVKNFQQCDYSFVALLPGRKGPDALRKTLEKVDFHDLMESRRHVLLAGNDRQAVPLCHCEQQTGYSGVRRRHEYIGAYAFADLKNPAVIYMPAGEISIDDAAFEGSSVTLVCTAGSPAAKWAEEHGTEVIIIARERT